MIGEQIHLVTQIGQGTKPPQHAEGRPAWLEKWLWGNHQYFHHHTQEASTAQIDR
jgi:hypothetical protein